MIGINSVDHYTTTPEDASAFERLRGGSWGGPDLPDSADLLYDTTGPAPTPTETAATTLVIRLAQQGIFGAGVTVAREGILSVTGVGLDVVTALYGDDAEVIERDGIVWVRIIRTMFADPFMVDGVAHDDPPF